MRGGSRQASPSPRRTTTTCCYALQDKVWVHGPDQEPQEVYIVKANAGTMAVKKGSTCCSGPASAAGC
jgi:hypothetical protein